MGFLVLQDMFEQKRSILEPAGAAAIAGAEAYCKYYGLKGETVVAITSGANMNFDRLRLVSQLADVGRRREGFLATFVPEKRGSFKLFCELVCRKKDLNLFHNTTSCFINSEVEIHICPAGWSNEYNRD